MVKRMGLAAAAQFCRRAGTSFRAGVDIVALCRSETRHGSSRQQAVMDEVSQRVAQGETLTAAMSQAGPRFFPRLLIAMVRLGEETGRLERALLELADHYQHRLEVRRNFFRAISLPALQFGVALMAIGLLIWITGFLPTGQNGEPFDVLGLGLYGNSGLAVYFLLLALAAGFLWLAYQAVRNNWFNLQAAVPLLYLVPKLGPALQTITLAKFTWTLAMSSDAGLDPFRAVELALDSTGSEYYRSETDTAHQAIRNGETLEGALRRTGIFPEDFLQEMEVAELSGTQAESLAHLAARYDERAKAAVGVIGVVATGAIWVTFSGILIFLIIRMALNVLGVYDEALEMVG